MHLLRQQTALGTKQRVGSPTIHIFYYRLMRTSMSI